MRRGLILAASAALVAAMLWPAVRSGDGFPFSDYPMFARPRPAVGAFNTVVLVGPRGEEEWLSPQAIGGTDQAVQAVATVDQAIGTGRAGELCAEIAARLDREGTLAIVTLRYDTVGWFRGDREPRERQVRAECPAVGP